MPYPICGIDVILAVEGAMLSKIMNGEVILMQAQLMFNHQTSGSIKDKKKTRRQWIKKLRNELRMPGSSTQAPKQGAQIPAPPAMSNAGTWNDETIMMCK